eukprot:scaffold76753_cov30-Tisochrysis_lutea.AAC.2
MFGAVCLGFGAHCHELGTGQRPAAAPVDTPVVSQPGNRTSGARTAQPAAAAGVGAVAAAEGAAGPPMSHCHGQPRHGSASPRAETRATRARRRSAVPPPDSNSGTREA